MRTIMRRALAPVLLLALAGCESLIGTVDRDATARDLAQARARWAVEGPTRYSYVLDLACTCVSEAARRPVLVSVDGTDIGIMYADPDDVEELGAPPAVYEQFASVPRLFALVEETLTRETLQFLVGYDAEYGFPRAYDAVFTDANGRIVFFASNFEDLD